jgi:hypothetical protein
MTNEIMSAIGLKQTSAIATALSVRFGGQADMPFTITNMRLQG